MYKVLKCLLHKMHTSMRLEKKVGEETHVKYMAVHNSTVHTMCLL